MEFVEEEKTTPKFYIIHENGKWLQPLRNALKELNIDYDEWEIVEGEISKNHINLLSEPPKGVFYNRVSPSSHTRDNRFSPEFTQGILEWLKLYNRPIINGLSPFSLELSKIRQYTVLKKFGINTPKTIACLGKGAILREARKFDFESNKQILLKHNRAGSGAGVVKFSSYKELENYILSGEYDKDLPVDGITLIQDYIDANYFYRLEFVDSKFLYAVKVRTGDFENCPCDDDKPKKTKSGSTKQGEPGPEPQSATETESSSSSSDEEEQGEVDQILQIDQQTGKVCKLEPKFQILLPSEFSYSWISQLEKLSKNLGYGAMAVEVIKTNEKNENEEEDNFVAFDVNANTNYNGKGEKDRNLPLVKTGMGAIANLGKSLLQQNYFC